jgi:hypothetical protein
MRGHEHGGSAGAAGREQVVHQSEAVAVQAVVGLVEKHHRRLLQKDARERQSLAHPGRVIGHRIRGACQQAHLLEPAQERWALDLAIEEAGGQLQVLEPGHGFIEGELMAQQRRLLPDALLFGADVVARHPGAALIGTNRRGQHANQGRLAGTVPAGDHHDTTAADAKADVGERPAAPEAPAETVGLDRRRGVLHRWVLPAGRRRVKRGDREGGDDRIHLTAMVSPP